MGQRHRLWPGWLRSRMGLLLPIRSLQVRLFLGTILGLLAVTAVFVVLGIRTVRESSLRAVNDRMVLATLAAKNLDIIIQTALDDLEDEASFFPFDPQEGITEEQKDRLRWISRRIDFFNYHVSLVDRYGTIRWVEPYDPSLPGSSLVHRPFVQEVLAEPRPNISNLVYSISGNPIIIIAVPVTDRQGTFSGFLSGEADLAAGGSFVQFIPQTELGASGYVQVLDSDGNVLMSSNPKGLKLGKNDQRRHFRSMIAEGQPRVGICYRCHEGSEGLKRERDIIAYYPLGVAPWGVVVRQLEVEAMADVRRLQREFLWSGLAFLIVAPLLVWVSTRRVFSSLRSLTAAAVRISQGDLDAEVPKVESNDEVGELAKSFAHMRVKIRDLLEEQRRWGENLELEVQRATSELQQRESFLNDLLRKLINAQEEERRRVARELHDEAAQVLTAVMMSAAKAEQAVPAEMKEAKARLVETRSRASQALDDIRRVILDLRPQILDDLGLIPALRWFVKNRLRTTGLEYRLDVNGIKGRLPGEVEVTVFRVVQEALTNVIRHSEASQVIIRLSLRDSLLVGTVEDNGRGFDVEGLLAALGRQEAWGLQGMEERVHLLGGVYSIQSQPGSGTKIRFQIPLESFQEGGQEDAEDTSIDS